MGDNENLGDETPEPESLRDFLAKSLGDGAASFFDSLEPDPMVEAWIGFHEFYKGLISGGFTRVDAIDITAAYLYRIASGMGDQ